MKGIDIFCASQASTAICLSMDIEQEASSSSASSPATIQLGGRTLDRHNPIICDGRRNTTSTINTLLSPPSNFSHQPISPQPHHQLTKTKKPPSKPIKKTKIKNPSAKLQDEDKETSHNVQSTDILKKSSFIPTDIVTRSFAKLSDLVTPPPAGSSRYLLGSDTQSQFFDGSPEFDPVFDMVPMEDYSKDIDTDVNQHESTCSTIQASSSQPPKPTPTKQVVVLMVSLHCKGCEGKVRKHLSRMEGVTSFNIDYAAKKVTIEGDVTPVSVLASVSKLKHAKFWTSPPPILPPLSPATTSLAVASTSATTEMPKNQLD